MGKRKGTEAYVLIIKDDLTPYVWLMQFTSLHDLTKADCLLQWSASFRTAKKRVSDKGTHFLNETIAETHERTKSKHHFTLPYSP